MIFPTNLLQKLVERKERGEYREIKVYSTNGVDFFSNDYLGLANKKELAKKNTEIQTFKNGATGSRLISGNSKFYNEIEDILADFYHSTSALLFVSGYLANVGLLSCLPQEEDTILFDKYCHASIRDGIRLSKAKSFSFNHNDYKDLEQKLHSTTGNCYVVVESLYSMDGDFCDLTILNDLCEKYNAYLIVDEAHSTGNYGKYGEGISYTENYSRIIARVHNFGKAFGSHGAVIVGQKELKEFLVNFCRSFIYTTGLNEASLLHIKNAHETIKESDIEREKLEDNIKYFRSKIKFSKYNLQFLDSTSPIQALLGEKQFLKEKETRLLDNFFLVKAIYSPSVERGKERIRICLHSTNTREEIDLFFNLLEK